MSCNRPPCEITRCCTPQAGVQDLSACFCKDCCVCPPPCCDNEVDCPPFICGIINQTPDGGRGGWGGYYGGGSAWGGEDSYGEEVNYAVSRAVATDDCIKYPQQSNNLPTLPQPPPHLDQQGLEGVRGYAGTNLPFKGKTTPSTPRRPFAEFNFLDRSNEIYDRLYNIKVVTNQLILMYADMWGVKGPGDPNLILTDIINITLNDVLRTQGGNTFVPFNGVTLGAYIRDTSIVESCLEKSTKEQLEQIETFNITAYDTAQYLKVAIKKAIKNGTLSDYSIPFLQDIVNSGKIFCPKGLPCPSNSNRLGVALSLIRNEGRSLYPRSYSNADDQRLVQRYRILPRDIDLTLPIICRSGKLTGVRVKNSDKLTFSKNETASCCYCGEGPTQTGNETLEVIKQNGTVVTLGLKSKRDVAYDFKYSQLSIIQGLLKNNQEFGVELTVSAPTIGAGDIERTGGSLEIPECLLFSSIRDTIVDVASPVPEFRKTQGKYSLAWKTGDDEALFDATVSAFSGPRMSFYIPEDDPIWNLILTQDDSDNQYYITALFNDLNITLDGKIFPRKFLTDFCIFPTNVTKYNPFQGNSNLVTYTSEEDAPIERTIKIILNPFEDVQRDDYVKGKSNSTGIFGEPNVYGIAFTKAFSNGEKTKFLSKTGVDFTSKKSILGKVLTLISDVDTNYNLEDGCIEGKRLPEGDMISFLTLNEYLDFLLKIPSKVRWSIFEGIYNNIKVFPIKLSDTEKTYINSERLIGTSMASQQKQTKTPQDLGYFDSRYKGKLYY